MWLPATSLVAFGVTYLARRYALARQVLDLPNERSAHSSPTPRGGGIGIVVPVLAGIALLAVGGFLDERVAVAMCGAGILVALVGFFDDHRSVEVHWRLLVHAVGAIWAVTWLGGAPVVDIGGRSLELGVAGDIVAVIGVMWLLNLYNFMDGIDGIAGIEAVTVGAAAALLYLRHTNAGFEWMPPALLAAAALGFLFWNWPPSRIFMGDGGSGFVGLMFGLMAIHSALISPRLMWVWVILLAVFITDATLTLFRRLLRDQKPHEAHTDHAYQCAARRVGSHMPVTTGTAAINLCWLVPVAAAVNEGWLSGWLGAVVAYAPLVWLGVRLGSVRGSERDVHTARP
jgi:Fuc2NAc and GlcNAc transferase